MEESGQQVGSHISWPPPAQLRRGDEVERSLELLDRVLSEFDDLENGNVSLEDDGYMSMNGRRLKPEFPPPPEEAQRIISTLLPRVSPSNSSKRNLRRGRLHTSLTLGHESRPELTPVNSATQTTIPKTRHARPFGWQMNGGGVPPRTVASVVEKHREVRREEPAFSDDSLEDVPPPPPPARHGSIAWEVPLDEGDPLYTPGSTKVIGRRRRRSTDRSSSGSMTRLKDCEEWPDPPTGTEDGSISPLSDSSHLDSSTASHRDEDIPSGGGTYVIRKGRRRQRKPVPIGPEPPPPPPHTNGELKRGSSTFDNIKSLLREGLIEGLDEAPPDFPPPTPPSGIVRVVSLPTLDSSRPSQRYSLEAPNEEDEDKVRKHDIGIQVTDEPDDSGSDPEPGKSVVLVNGITDTSSNEALMAELKKEYDTESINNNQHLATESSLSDPWLTAAEVSQVQVIPVVEKEPEVVVPEEKPPREFKVKVEVLQHEFGPLPPSPVEEDDEYSDVLKPSPAQTPRGVCNDKREPFYRCLEPPASDPLGTKILNKSNSDHHKDGTSSLKTRSMDAGFSRSHRTHHSSSSSSSANRKDVPSERRTLPTELQGPSRRRTLQKRGGREEGSMQVSCSLPETPIFARGCDIPRTPHRRAPEVPATSRTTPRQLPTSTAYRTNSGGVSLSEAMAGAELLRLAGGPGRGWYPRHRHHPRPASVEHLDRLPPLWDAKPQTLPPNITPKFYRSPRDALRRVTSLLIRRGNSKEKKDTLSPTSGFAGESGEAGRQKKGFFRSFWKRSRHYSLEQQ